jgi:hypothetical protein
MCDTPQDPAASGPQPRRPVRQAHRDPLVRLAVASNRPFPRKPFPAWFLLLLDYVRDDLSVDEPLTLAAAVHASFGRVGAAIRVEAGFDRPIPLTLLTVICAPAYERLRRLIDFTARAEFDHSRQLVDRRYSTNPAEAQKRFNLLDRLGLLIRSVDSGDAPRPSDYDQIQAEYLKLYYELHCVRSVPVHQLGQLHRHLRTTADNSLLIGSGTGDDVRDWVCRTPPERNRLGKLILDSWDGHPHPLPSFSAPIALSALWFSTSDSRKTLGTCSAMFDHPLPFLYFAPKLKDVAPAPRNYKAIGTMVRPFSDFLRQLDKIRTSYCQNTIGLEPEADVRFRRVRDLLERLTLEERDTVRRYMRIVPGLWLRLAAFLALLRCHGGVPSAISLADLRGAWPLAKCLAGTSVHALYERIDPTGQIRSRSRRHAESAEQRMFRKIVEHGPVLWTKLRRTYDCQDAAALRQICNNLIDQGLIKRVGRHHLACAVDLEDGMQCLGQDFTALQSPPHPPRGNSFFRKR